MNPTDNNPPPNGIQGDNKLEITDSGTKERIINPPEKKNNPMPTDRSGQGALMRQNCILLIADSTIKESPRTIPYVLEILKFSARTSSSAAVKTCFPAAPIKTLKATHNAPYATHNFDSLSN